jgi:glycosyltransferase involved in cell wall biosynthesis
MTDVTLVGFDLCSEWEINGNWKMAIELGKHLLKRGHAVQILASAQEQFSGNNVEGMDVTIVKGSRLYQLSQIATWKSLLLKMKTDVIHGHGVTTSWWCAILSRVTKIPGISTINGIRELPSLWGPVTPSFARNLNTLQLSNLICSNKFLLVHLPFYCVNKSTIAYYGISEKLFDVRSNKKSNEFEVAFWGEGKVRRGFDILLHAMRDVLKQCKDIRFKMYVKPEWQSSGYYSSRMRFIRAYRNNVSIETYPYNFDIFEAVANADIVILPFLQNPMEPPLTLIESMALGKAIVTTELGGNGEFVKNNHTGVLIPPNDGKLLAKVILDLYNDREKVEKIGQNARRNIMEIYDWNRALQTIEDKYEEAS